MSTPYRHVHQKWLRLRFEAVRTEKNKLAAKCLECQKIFKNTGVNRLQSHRHACRGPLLIMPEYVSPSDYDQDEQEEESTMKEEEEFVVKEEAEYDNSPYSLLSNVPTYELKNQAEESAEDLPYSAMPSTSSGPPAKKQKDIMGAFYSPAKTNTPLKKRFNNPLDLTLAKFFIGCNIPFSVVESQHFKNFVQALRPSYKPPVLNELSTVLLDSVTVELKEADTIKFKADTDCVLLIDSSIEENSMHTMLRSSDRVTYLESFDVTAESDTHKAIRKIVQTSAKTVQSRFGGVAEFFAVVSPHPSAEMADNQRVMHIACSWCAAGCLMKDVLDKELAAKVASINAEFQRPRMLKEILKLGGKQVVTASDTQWTSYYASHQSILSNLYILRLIATTSAVSSCVAELLHSEQFIDSVEDAVKLYEPICTIIEASQESSLADITELWLLFSLPDKTSTETMDRHRRTVLNKFALTANFLHHTYRGRNFTVDHLDTVEEYLISVLDDNGLNDLMAYKKSEGLMGTLFAKNLSSPITFWTLAARKHESLANLALKLMRIPASSTLFNRPSYRWATVHTRNKDKLSCEGLENLLYSYCVLRTNDIETDDF